MDLRIVPNTPQFSFLPTELVAQVIEKLDTCTLRDATVVNHQWYQLVKSKMNREKKKLLEGYLF